MTLAHGCQCCWALDVCANNRLVDARRSVSSAKVSHFTGIQIGTRRTWVQCEVPEQVLRLACKRGACIGFSPPAGGQIRRINLLCSHTSKVRPSANNTKASFQASHAGVDPGPCCQYIMPSALVMLATVLQGLPRSYTAYSHMLHMTRDCGSSSIKSNSLSTLHQRASSVIKCITSYSEAGALDRHGIYHHIMLTSSHPPYSL